MKDLTKRRKKIVEFVKDVIIEIVNAPIEKRNTDKEDYVVSISIEEVGNKRNHIYREFHRDDDKNLDLFENSNLEEKGNKPALVKVHTSIIDEYEIKGTKFSISAKGLEPDENTILCVAIIAFLEERHTDVVCERIQTAGYKLPQMLKDNRLHHLCEVLFMQNWVYAGGNWGVRKKN